jgi:para-nitrobenzyl esterase
MTAITITTSGGPLVGEVVDGVVEGVEGGEKGGGDVVVLRGVRYAHAARFAPPVPVPPWAEPRDARTSGAQAPQLPSILDRMLGPSSLPYDEDCLFLNVWAPAHARAADRLPVLVFFHGGAFFNGTGATPWFDGTAFARAGCVLVTVNYRLGLLGFTHLPEAGERFALSGNLGLLDQVEALRWVAREVAVVGGDPANVTIVGESAGGASVLALMCAPSARGLFHRGWAMSPSITQLRSTARAVEAGEEVLQALGLTAATADRLLELPLDGLLDAQRRLLASGELFTLFAPTPDGTVLPRPVPGGLADGPAATLPLVLGTLRDEMNLFAMADPRLMTLDDAGLRAEARPWLGDRVDTVISAYRAARPGSTAAQLGSAIATDQAFRAPATRVAERRADAAAAPSWLYWFTWATPAFGGLLGACHGLDLPFAFQTLDAIGVELFTGGGSDRYGLADAFHGALVDFARHGRVGWPAYDLTDRPVMRFDVPGELLHDPEPELRTLWP